MIQCPRCDTRLLMRDEGPIKCFACGRIFNPATQTYDEESLPDRKSMRTIVSNRRRAERIPTAGRVHFATIQGNLIDLNQFGCSAQFPRGIFVPESIIDLIIEVEGSQQPLKKKARVVRFDTNSRVAAFEFEQD